MSSRTPLETIQAAIDKLEALGAESSEGPWAFEDEHGDVAGATPAWCVNKTSDDGLWLGDVAYLPQTDGPERADAELIVTLHRTIDAQLAILIEALRLGKHFTSRFPATDYDHAAVALARAILGEES